jgi:ubiquinol-cytochrome c reductase cytochrome c1 subunit
LFGAAPPDLSVIARSRAGAGGSGADYLYTYLRSYYRDDTTTTGWNNLAFPSVAMPHVLWELQGERKPIFEEKQEHGHAVKTFTGKWEQVTKGTMTSAAFDQSVGDLVNFLQWMGEPGQAKRTSLGWYVLAFLSMLAFFTWRLSKAYWKDVK